MAIKVPAGMEVCYKCGGDGGEPGSNFGDHGWHPCFKCGTTGYLPEGTEERERAMYEAEVAACGPPRWPSDWD